MATTGLRQRLRRWWLARVPACDSLTLTQRNVYILPTRAGLVFALTLLLMLLASINYQLNLGYALTFLLAGAGLVSMHLTHGTLRGLTLHLRPTTAVFVGDAAPLEIVLVSRGPARHGVGLRLEDGAAHGSNIVWTDVPAQGQATAHMTLVPPRRGRHPVPLLVIDTLFPFGLFRAWSVWRPTAQVLAWPRPETPTPALPQAQARADEQHAHLSRAAGGEFDGVRAWRRGDGLRQVLWKKVARSGELVSRDTAGQAARELTLDWQATRISGAEPRLARLAAWVVEADRQGHAFRLTLPGVDLPSGRGEAQRRAALQALALWH